MGAMSDTRIIYFPREDATPEGEVVTLAAVFRYLLDCRERHDDDLAADGAEERGEHAK
jgi:hypothetical protein